MSEYFKLNPAVFAVDKNYQIMMPCEKACLFFVRVGNKYYYDESNGIMRSSNEIHKIEVPAKELDEAKEYNFLGVCVNPCYVPLAKENLAGSDVKIVTVVGFPLGANTTETKIFETINAVRDGADEIDMVINVTKLKDRELDYIVNEIVNLLKNKGIKL